MSRLFCRSLIAEERRTIYRAMSQTPWKRKYQWRLTRPEQDKEDWSAYHDGLFIGRVSRDRTSRFSGKFSWSGGCSCWWEFKRPMPQYGWEDEAWQAARAVENWYDEGCAATGPRPAAVARRIADLKARGAKFGW
ncbi:hypothetical protein KYK30_31690 [Shinella yambaruensis]|uniref:Uncharacterized protein n=1 Tax=Shinella yambaruensis TaxID=415996 RepID=A0ABQ5ZWN5_9HYPH|nr:hypothetical protein [Shinella yambaruensis]MCJ8029996.1 hypothetical protein [Shinella yambaruensis]MCU7984288.1 hypothetical protein [Shinella yambaruensis]GLR55117.1 hypothetical protein GCM10007923_63380 [Shinella yambaruensis]